MKETDSPFPSSHQIPVVPLVEWAGEGLPLASFSSMLGVWLAQLRAGSSRCKFMCKMELPCSANAQSDFL